MNDEQNYEVTEDGKVILKKLPFTGVRRKMAQNLEHSWHTAVSCTSFNKVDTTEVVALKKKYAAEGCKVSYTDIFTRLVAVAVQENPMVNVMINTETKKLEVYKNVNIGMAISTPDGMVLNPVIRDAERKSVFEISAEVKGFVQKIKDRTITAEDMQGATMTVSSLGMYDICGFVQVLIEPQSFIVGFGNIRQEPAVLEDGTIAARPMMYISDTTDHRAIHGETLMLFYRTLLSLFKNPEKYMEP